MDKLDIIEIRVRRFFTSKEADVTPMSIILVGGDGTGQVPDWPKLMEALAANTMGQVDGVPLKHIRPMTLAEIEKYRLDEAEE